MKKNEEIKHLSIRIDDDMLKKFRYICKYEGRSANNQMLIYIRSTISEFERRHGEITGDNNSK